MPVIDCSEAADLIMRSCLLLDEERFGDYLNLFTADGRYRITSFSPDLRKDLTFLDLDRSGLESLLQNVPHHVRLAGRFMRHVNGSIVEPTEAGQAAATTSVLVIHTDLDGNSKIFAAGRYRDTIEVVDGASRLKAREVRLDTRQFGPGSHLPL